jgi:hypothetical protein
VSKVCFSAAFFMTLLKINRKFSSFADSACYAYGYAVAVGDLLAIANPKPVPSLFASHFDL